MRKNIILYLIPAIVFLSYLVSAYFYPRVPDLMASHWNMRGEVDGYMNKFWGVYLIPIMLTVMWVIFMIMPRVDPLRKNVDKFKNYFYGFIFATFTFLVFLQLQMLLWNTGIKIAMNITMPIGLGILFYFIGVLCDHSKRNWFIGIKTPWTLSSDIVWDKTHKLAGKLYKMAGLISIGGVFSSKYAFIITICPIMIVSLYLVLYSYLEYKKVNNKQGSLLVHYNGFFLSSIKSSLYIFSLL